MSRDRLYEEAQAIARDLAKRRVFAKDGSVTWLGPKYSQEENRYKRVPLPPHLYNGTAGIAVFLAAAERFLGDGSGALCREAIAPLRRMLAGLAADPERGRRSKIPVAGMTGLGSYVYTLLKVGAFLDDPDLLREAHALTALFTPERIAADEALDVVTGSAGAILALLALDRVAPEPNAAGFTPLEAASALGRHLLDRRASFEGRPRAWPWPGNEDRAPLTGYSHGAGGICCALLRLYARTRDPELWEAAQEGLAFERSVYSPEHKNWRDLRVPYPRFMFAWCHGAPGVALARLGALDVADDAEIRDDVRNGLETTLTLEETWLDSLCCGNVGRAEILLYAHGRLGEPHLLDEARRLVESALDRRAANGDFGWIPLGWENVHDPSLLRGAAGIGYTLLRFADPASLPCILLFD